MEQDLDEPAKGGVWTVVVLQTVDEIRERSADWSRLHGCSARANLFDDLDYFLASCVHDRRVHSPYVLFLYRDGEPVGALIGRIQDSRLEFRIGYLAPIGRSVRALSIVRGGILAAESNPACLGRMIRRARELISKGIVKAILYNGVEDDSLVDEVLSRSATALQRHYILRRHIHYFTQVRESMDEFFAVRRDSRRKVRQEYRAFHREYGDCAKFRTFAGPEDLALFLADAERVAAQTYQRRLGVGFANSEMERELYRRASNSGAFQSYVLYVNAVPIAFMVGLGVGNTYFALQMGYERRYRSSSPGTVMILSILEHLGKQGRYVYFDWGIGEGVHKHKHHDFYTKESSMVMFGNTILSALFVLCWTLLDVMKKALEAAVGVVRIAPWLKRVWRNSG